MTFLLQHPQYSYKVKIINPKRKSDVMLRQLHNFHGKFESMVGLRASLIEEFSEKKYLSHSLSTLAILKAKDTVRYRSFL